MKKTLILFVMLIIVIIVVSLIYKDQIFKIQNKEKQIIMNKNLQNLVGKKIAIIIAFRDFRDEEYFIPKEVLEKSGAEITTVSAEKGIAVGLQGGEANVEIDFSELKVSDFDAIVFVGGPGASKYLDNETSYKIAEDAVFQGKVLAAICISPTILAKAGVLSGKKATVWSSPLDKSAIKILKENGAIYQKEKVVVDGRIITADGPLSAKEFGEAVVSLLQ